LKYIIGNFAAAISAMICLRLAYAVGFGLR